MTSEEKEKEKFIGELREFWNLTHKYLEIIFWISLWLFIIVVWTWKSIYERDIPSILCAIIFDSLGIFYIYEYIKKWKAIKLNSITTNTDKLRGNK